ncbi:MULTISPECIES: RidA family protein [unclassified Marinobacter]|uniref:RidA family protein n=1 Tax=unclassified Marinobacter TaxID=83889 RepID=UPI002580C523|nr:MULTISPECIES: RidA family protein [unclassified Marinobacter]
MTIRYLGSGPRMSQVIIHNGTVHTAGQVATDASANAQGQTQQILDGLDSLLAEAGTDKAHLLSATIWVADMADFSGMNSAWDAWVTPGRTPVRACVEARLAKPEWKVEIMVVAALPD